MIPYDSILQMVNGKVYSLHHIWSSFHIHQPITTPSAFMASLPRTGSLSWCKQMVITLFIKDCQKRW
jgi:hypothetical protein